MNDSFSALHPALTFCYFVAVLLLTMLVLHPVFLALSLLGALPGHSDSSVLFICQ